MFRVEVPRELAHWSRSLVQGAHDAASLIKEINCGKLAVMQTRILSTLVFFFSSVYCLYTQLLW